MNRKTALCIAIALTMATGQLSFAQGNSNHDERGGNQGNSNRDERGDRHDNGNRNERGNQGRPPQHPVTVAAHHDNRDFGRAHEQERSQGRGVGPNHEYYRGDRLPVEYRHRNYVVDDWRGHHLSAPPSGYQWVQSGSDYILIAIATGLIAQLLLSHY
jgi:Ni/Co efflux regulator RcnB